MGFFLVCSVKMCLTRLRTFMNYFFLLSYIFLFEHLHFFRSNNLVRQYFYVLRARLVYRPLLVFSCKKGLEKNVVDTLLYFETLSPRNGCILFLLL